MNRTETTARFDFALEFPQNWQECLQKLKKDGFNAISSHVYWGLHESAPGIRDFSKSSKLKVEKFLQVAATVGLKVDLVFGFMPSRYTFPEWVKSLSCANAIVPAMVWDGISGPYFLNEVPSLETPEIASSFLSFVEEAMTFLPLYQEPEGTLRKVYFDAGIYQYNQSIADDGSFSRWLEEQYGTISVLNSKYQTAFNNFSNAGSKTGFRVMLDKRPWLAAFDYKSARNAHLSNFNQKVKALSQEVEIQIKDLEENSNPTKWGVAFDSVFVEGKEALFPFSPEALVLPQSVMGFRFLQSIKETFFDWDFSPLPIWKSTETHSSQNQVVINGKYLSTSGLAWIRSSLKSGAQLFFPFGLPQFDEQMKLSGLTDHVTRETVQISSEQRLQVYKIETGKILLPEPHCVFDMNFPAQLERILSSVESGAPV